jgi:hypothetical protein
MRNSRKAATAAMPIEMPRFMRVRRSPSGIGAYVCRRR